ncbi:MAG: group III truncated hemoglobin [Bacteroidota bacterium]
MPGRDIETEADIRAIVHAFYQDMEADPVIGTYFAGLDWDTHLPKMVSFWSSVVFQTGAYRGRPFAPHARMPGLAREHFAAWVGRLHATVDAHAAGPRAEQMKARGEQIAGVFQVKLGLWGTFAPGGESVAG